MDNSTDVNTTSLNGTFPRYSFPLFFTKMEWIFGILVTHSLFALFIVVCNMTVLYAFYKNSRLRNATNSVLMSMAVADLAIGLVVFPIWLHIIDIGYNRGPPFVKAELLLFEAYQYIDQSLGLTSVYHLVYLHSLRSYSIVFPIQHRKMSKRPVAIALFLIWAICIAFPPVTRKLIIPKTCKYCFVYITLITNIGIPLVVITAANFFLWRAVAKSARQHQQNDTKLLVTIAILIGLLLVCFLPFMIANVIERTNGTLLPIQTILLLKFLHFSNSAFNPVVYALRNPEMLRTIKKVICQESSRDVTTNTQNLTRSGNPTRMAPVTVGVRSN